LLGWLFRSSTGKFEKTNLLIFIRPTIIRNRADLARVTERARVRYDASQGPQSVSGTVRADMGLKEPEKETPSAGGTEAEAAGATEQP
jgi:type II secretory pathway component GspD/PulD (secretin)